MNRQRLLLTILLVVFVMALFYAFWATPRQSKVAVTGSSRPTTTSPQAVAKLPAPEDGNRVRLELLARETESAPGFKRNIFRFWQPPPKPMPAPPPPPPPPVPAGETLAPAEIQKELAKFTFLGFLLKDGVKTIFLSSNDELFMVKKGDRFGKDKHFLVTDLTPEMLIIRQNDDPRSITVPLAEQTPLTPSGLGPAASRIRRTPLSRTPSYRRGFTPQQGTGGIRRPAEPYAQPIVEESPFEQQPIEQPPIEQPPEDGATPPLEAEPIELPPAEEAIPLLETAPNEVPHD